jgi:hypothetical protein
MSNSWLRWLIIGLLGGVAIVWLWQAVSDSQQLLPASGFALIVLVGAFWQYRVQAVRRWRSAVDAYAERTLAAKSKFVTGKTPSMRKLGGMHRVHWLRFRPTKRHSDESSVTDPMRRRSK